MGRDKALIPVGDGHLIDRAIGALRAAGALEVVVVGGDAAGLIGKGDRWLADRWPGEGPLGGVITALEAATTDVVVVLACDLTGPTAEGVWLVLDELAGAEASIAVAVPRVDGRRQWLHGAWRRSALADLEAAFGRGVRGPRGAVADRALVIDHAPLEWFHDADTPADLQL